MGLNKDNEAKKSATALTLQELQKVQQLQKTLDAADDERMRSNPYTKFCHKIAPVFAYADARTRLEGREEFDKMVDQFLEERDKKTRGKPEPSSTTYLDHQTVWRDFSKIPLCQNTALARLSASLIKK